MAATGNICASIAESNVSRLKEQIDNAFKKGADLVEIRFDFIQESELSQAIEITAAFKKKAIFTLRPMTQGGKFEGEEQNRIIWIKKMIDVNPMFVDIEIDTLRENNYLADYIENARTAILVSYHDFNQTPNSDKLADILSEMRVYSSNIKIVTTANHIEDSTKILDLYENSAGLNLVAFAMGRDGVLSRVLCTIVGNAPFTYASTGQAIAPGQLNIEQMRKLYDRISNRLGAVNAKSH